MKVLLYSEYGHHPKGVEPLLESVNLQLSYEKPEVVITVGGDGTLIGAERDYPGIPKLPLKHSEVGSRTIPLEISDALKLFVQNKLKLNEFLKLEVAFKNEKFSALNDAVIRNSLPNSALRFSLEPVALTSGPSEEYVGDGIVVSTPFGSSGYFYSITRQVFKEGIGLAFNNIHNVNAQHQILKSDAEVTVTIIRGPGVLAVDNNPNMPKLNEDDKILIRRSDKTAKIFSLP